MAYALDLSRPELKLLQELLHGDEARLRFEIAHTDHRTFKDQLKLREELLSGIIRKIESRSV